MLGTIGKSRELLEDLSNGSTPNSKRDQILMAACTNSSPRRPPRGGGDCHNRGPVLGDNISRSINGATIISSQYLGHLNCGGRFLLLFEFGATCTGRLARIPFVCVLRVARGIPGLEIIFV